MGGRRKMRKRRKRRRKEKEESRSCGVREFCVCRFACSSSAIGSTLSHHTTHTQHITTPRTPHPNDTPLSYTCHSPPLTTTHHTTFSHPNRWEHPVPRRLRQQQQRDVWSVHTTPGACFHSQHHHALYLCLSSVRSGEQRKWHLQQPR